MRGIDDKFFQSKSLARIAQRLRKHISVPANLLDIAATVDKTTQKGPKGYRDRRHSFINAIQSIYNNIWLFRIFHLTFGDLWAIL